ncbi:MAG: LacI family DNA-binding transcriptional regulator [Chloroflexi bacterium]|nr:LacI family DNA-binding transcriptional regulator [Chloroflexota bacterium]
MPNIRDVAERAGVAPITVSRVINDTGYVSDELRQRVEQAISDLNYVPNRLGPSMRSKRSNTVGLVVADITNPFWTTVVRGVEDAAYKAGYHLFLCNSDESVYKEREYVELLLSRQVDGFLIVPAETQFDVLELIQKQEKAIVLLDRYVQTRAIDIVRGDSDGAGYLLTRHLLDLQHRDIAMLNGPRMASTAVERAKGYRRAMNEAGLSDKSERILWGAYTQESGYYQTLEALQWRPRPTALIAANNFIALGVVRVLDNFGLRIPEDLSLVVFDDLPVEVNMRPFFTSADQPAYEMGFLAANTLFERLAGNRNSAFKDIVLPFALTVRSSSGPAPGP